MSNKSANKTKRLISFRERERDEAAAKMAATRTSLNEAKAALESAEESVSQEIEQTRSAVGKPVSAEKLNLTADCAQSAAKEVVQKQGSVREANEALDEDMDKLMQTHTKVKQMELLLEFQQRRNERLIRNKEQSTLDDLSVSRKVHK